MHMHQLFHILKNYSHSSDTKAEDIAQSYKVGGKTKGSYTDSREYEDLTSFPFLFELKLKLRTRPATRFDWRSVDHVDAPTFPFLARNWQNSRY